MNGIKMSDLMPQMSLKFWECRSSLWQCLQGPGVIDQWGCSNPVYIVLYNPGTWCGLVACNVRYVAKTPTNLVQATVVLRVCGISYKTLHKEKKGKVEREKVQLHDQLRSRPPLLLPWSHRAMKIRQQPIRQKSAYSMVDHSYSSMQEIAEA